MQTEGPDFDLSSPDKNVLDIGIKVTAPCSSWEQWFLISSDRHHDNPHTKTDLELKHLDMAVERNAGIIDNGDLFCAMQGKYDPRSNKTTWPPGYHQFILDGGKTPYLDWLVDDAARFYGPYAKNILVIKPGNHEDSIHKRCETRLDERLVARLNTPELGGRVFLGGYTTWVRFSFHVTKTVRCSRVMWLHHGYAGGGPVTKDTIQLNRQLTYLDNVDYIVTGHTHDGWTMPIQRIGLNRNGKRITRTTWGVKTPTYKDEYGDGSGGWHISTGKPPKPVGAWWLRFWCENHEIKQEFIWAQ